MIRTHAAALFALACGVLAGPAACAHEPQGARQRVAPAATSVDSETTMKKGASIVSGTIKFDFVGTRPSRPPITTLLFDVRLQNTSDAARWFLVPTTLGSGAWLEGEVWGCETFQMVGAARVVVGRFMGNGGFQAVHLPAGADVTIKRLPVDHYGAEVKGDKTLHAVIATEIEVGGKPAASWLGVPATSAAAGVVTDDGSELCGGHENENFAVVPVATRGAETTTTTVAVDPAQR